MALFLDDQFDRSGGLLGSSAAPTGGTWSTLDTDFLPQDATLNGTAAVLAAIDPSFFKNSAAATGNTQTNTLTFTPTGDNWQAIVHLRVQGDDSCYQLILGPSTTTGCGMSRRASTDNWGGVGFGGAGTGYTATVGDRSQHTLSYTVTGSVFSAAFDGTPITFASSTTDATITAAGVAGFGGRDISVTSFTADGSTTGGDTTAPVITGPGGATGSTSSASVAENTTAVHTFTANEAVTWSLNGGADVARFTINSSTGALAFSSAPNFEAPNDSDTNNTYVVVVRATDTATPTPNTTNQTVTVTVTDVAEGGDTTNPTLTGSITVSALTTTSYTLTWPAGSDNVAVTGYEVSLNGGSSYASVGNVLTTNITGRTPGSTDAVRVRAFDAAGNRSTPALSASVTLNSATGTLTLTTPIINNTGPISGRWINLTGITLTVVSMTTKASVLVVTGRATDAAGVLTAAISDAAIITGQDYRIVPTFGSNAGVTQVLTAT
jgi:hypothetical protein